MRESREYTDIFEREVGRRVAGSPRSVIVGVSGGADSVALLLSLLSAGKEVTAVHCNFCLRGEESERDRDFVERLCERLGVRLIVRQFDTLGYMAEKQLSMEMACRELRYDLFRDLIRKGYGEVVAVGHHRDDNVETMLINMLRGSGIEGMKGMTYSQADIIRPLLSFSRDDILRYLEAKQQDYITDSSNLSNEPLRNFIRRDVIPLLESRVPEAMCSMERTRSMLERAWKVYCKANDKWHGNLLQSSMLCAAADALTAIHEFLKGKGGNAAIEQEMLDFFERGSREGRVWHLKEGDVATMRGDFYFIPELQEEMPEIDAEPLADITECEFSDNDILYLPGSPDKYIWQNAAKGMKMRLQGINGRKKVYDILSESGIPSAARGRVKILVRGSDGEPIWIPSVRRSSADVVTTSDTTIYKIRLREEPFYWHWVKK